MSVTIEEIPKKDVSCHVCGISIREHKFFQREHLPVDPKTPELIDIEGETWVLCFGFDFIIKVWFGIPVAKADPDVVQGLPRNTMTIEEFSDLYQ